MFVLYLLDHNFIFGGGVNDQVPNVSLFHRATTAGSVNKVCVTFKSVAPWKNIQKKNGWFCLFFFIVYSIDWVQVHGHSRLGNVAMCWAATRYYYFDNHKNTRNKAIVFTFLEFITILCNFIFYSYSAKVKMLSFCCVWKGEKNSTLVHPVLCY